MIEKSISPKVGLMLTMTKKMISPILGLMKKMLSLPPKYWQKNTSW